jgi:hypothetical protein
MFKLFSVALLVDFSRLNVDLCIDFAVSVFYEKYIYNIHNNNIYNIFTRSRSTYSSSSVWLLTLQISQYTIVEALNKK